MKCLSTNILLLVAVLAMNGALAQSPNWPNWRGPLHNGSQSSQLGAPGKVGLEDNLHWKTELPGDGASTPVIHGESLFASAEDSEQNL